jgi:hypothetical protein
MDRACVLRRAGRRARAQELAGDYRALYDNAGMVALMTEASLCGIGDGLGQHSYHVEVVNGSGCVKLAVAVLNDYGTDAQRTPGLIRPQADAAVRRDVGRREDTNYCVGADEVTGAALLLLGAQSADLAVQLKDIVAELLNLGH